MQITAAIFDVGGVLHSLEMEHVKQDIISTLGIDEEQYDRVSDDLYKPLRLGQITEDEFWQQFITLTRAPNQLPPESLLGREYKRRYKIYEDTLDIVRALKDQGVKLAVLSNTIQIHADINQAQGVYDLFKIKILSHEVGLEKPDERIYQLTLKRLNTTPDQAVLIDDKAENILAARALGIHAIQFHNAQQLTATLNKLGLEVYCHY